ncbi:hypothetical protein MKX01_013822, partial [Papaver californicum]
DDAKAAVMFGFSQILHQVVDFQIILNSYNMKQRVQSSFTVTRIHLHHELVHDVKSVDIN